MIAPLALLLLQAAPALPAPVQATLAKLYPAATVQRWKEEREHGHQVIEVIAKDQQGVVELSFSTDGTFLAQERVVPLTAVPAAVKAAFAASALGKLPIEKVEEIHEGSAVRYELLVKQPDGKKREIVYSIDGTLVEDEPATEG